MLYIVYSAVTQLGYGHWSILTMWWWGLDQCW